MNYLEKCEQIETIGMVAAITEELYTATHGEE